MLIALGAYERTLTLCDDCASVGIANPLIMGWRGPPVRCLALLGRHEESREAAAGLLAVSEEWGTPRAMDRALRYAASVEPGPDRLEMLGSSVRLLEDTHSHPERAHSLHAFGAALVAADRPDEAATRLTRRVRPGRLLRRPPSLRWASPPLPRAAAP
ncbi:hypothetical protein EDD29_2546 [Actinocorallia herbida]|uniref:Tetratricopeptide repeat protein n=1 Tax=Actinocorallia herbida TaxID=58109 RepID=A0A3N1CUM6_9ACTN|nr:hypothetical protein [Actinocorallia herbida]ROO85011.1 hypothetical protein EDD29_2546 [Actinocorallia herbida]